MQESYLNKEYQLERTADKSLKCLMRFIFNLKAFKANHIPDDEMNTKLHLLHTIKLSRLKSVTIKGRNEEPLEMGILTKFIELPRIESIRIQGCFLGMRKVEKNSREMEDEEEELCRAIKGNKSLKKFNYYDKLDPEDRIHDPETYSNIFRAFANHPRIQEISVYEGYLSGSFGGIAHLIEHTKTLKSLQISHNWNAKEFEELNTLLRGNCSIEMLWNNKYGLDIFEAEIRFLKSLQSSSLRTIELKSRW